MVAKMFHKRYYKFIILALLLMVGSVGAIPVEEWNKTFGIGEVKSMQQTSDGGYILVGNGGSYGQEAKLLKTDPNGNEQWNNTFNFTHGAPGYYTPNAFASSVRQTSDGGYVIAGSTSGYYTHALIIKTDAEGNKQCENFNFRASAPNSGSWANSVVQSSDGGYVLVGELGRTPLGYGSDALILKANPDCSEQWNQNTGWIGGMSVANSVQQTSDGGYIIAGETNANGAGALDGLLIKTNSNGEMQLIKFYGGKNGDSISSIQQTTDNGYIFAGSTSSFAPTGNAWLTKLDSNGNEQWNKTYTGTVYSQAYSVDQTKDKGYIFAGKNLLVKTDKNGNKLWNITLKGTANSVQQTSDNGYILAGDIYRDGQNVYWLIKFAAEDNNPPNTSISFSGTLGNNNWYTSDVQVILTSTDNEGGSGVSKTEYSLDNGLSWIQYSNPFTFSNEGSTTISYRSIDKAGNIEQTNNQMIQIDKTAPSISGAATTSPNAMDWYKSDVTIQFTASDAGSGIDTITPDTTISTEAASQSVSGTATDKAGNSASATVSGINIDKTIPSIIISSPEAKDYLKSGSLTLNFAASDILSGIDSITFSLDSTSVINGQVIDLSTLTIGQHTLTVNAIDKAGSTATKSVTFNLIGTIPVIVHADVEVNPNTLNKASKGGVVTVYIEIPGYDVNNIDLSIVKLSTNKGEVSAMLSHTEEGDHNNNGIPDLMVKFDREAVIDIVDIGDVEVTVSGKISGEDFQGSDIIHVIDNHEQIPEFPTVALPIISIIGLMLLFQRRKRG